MKDILERVGRSKEKHLFIKFRVKNFDERRIVDFRKNTIFSNFVLRDDVENIVRGVSFGFSSKIVGALKNFDEINPGKEATHVEVFRVPLEKTEFLMLEINLKAFSEEAKKIYFKIPIAKVAGFQEFIREQESEAK